MLSFLQLSFLISFSQCLKDNFTMCKLRPSDQILPSSLEKIFYTYLEVGFSKFGRISTTTVATYCFFFEEKIPIKTEIEVECYPCLTPEEEEKMRSRISIDFHALILIFIPLCTCIVVLNVNFWKEPQQHKCAKSTSKTYNPFHQDQCACDTRTQEI